MYCETYKNTLVVDILKYFGLIKLYGGLKSTSNAVFTNEKEIQDISILNGDQKIRNILAIGPSFKRIVFVCNIILLFCITYVGSSFYTPEQEMLYKEKFMLDT